MKPLQINVHFIRHKVWPLPARRMREVSGV
jgi:hypothetical protein